MTFLNGFLSGIGHPVIEPVHLLFLLGLSLLLGAVKIDTAKAIFLILSFVFATSAGTLCTRNELLNSILPLALASSLLIVGSLIWTQLIPRLAGLMFILVAGFFHGLAFSETIIGAEPTPILAYVVGLIVVQMVVMCMVFLACRHFSALYRGAMKLLLRSAAASLIAIGAVMAFNF